jgi:hypothetical protein
MAFAAEPAPAAAPATVTKEATGQAAITKAGGESKAYDEALKNALRAAVEEAAGVLITADTQTLNSILVRDQVYARSAGYVKKFDVVSKATDKGVMTVVVKAEVLTADLDKDLQAVKGLIGRLGRNKLIIVTQEQAIDDKGVSVKSEVLSSALTESFKKDGWQILDEKGGGDSLKLAGGVAQGTPAVKDVLKTTDADYIVYGTVNFRYHVLEIGGKDKDGNPVIFPVSAEYDLAMYNVRTRDQLAKVSGKFDQGQMYSKGVKTGISYTRTSQDFCKLEAPRIISELRTPVIEYLRNSSVNGTEVTLIVSGLPDLSGVDDFAAAVKTIKDVGEVKQNGDYDNGKMQYAVTVTSSAMDFGKVLGKSKFKKKALKVTAVKNNTVEVAISK